MPFGSFFKKMFKKTAGDVAHQVGGDSARQFVESNIDQRIDDSQLESGMDSVLQSFTGNQQSGLQSLFNLAGGNLGGVEERASNKGLDPQLISSLVGMLGSGGGGGGASSGGSGFSLGSLLQVAKMLTKDGSEGGGGVQGFLNLIQGGGGSTGSSGSIFKILIGLAKSFFSMKMGNSKSLQDWGDAGAKSGKDDGNFGNWAGHVIKDLVNPGKKDKDRIDDDPVAEDKPTGGEDNVKGWFDNHPEIGKMQKDIFDDVFDTTDEDDRLIDDPAPLIPAPVGFEPDCSMLDQASILFLNTNIMLDLRKEWRFLYSTKAHARDWNEFFERISYRGPTMTIIQDADGNMLGAFASTSWGDSEGNWMGNGDSFIFAIKPKMAIFHSTGQDDNFMLMTPSEGLCMGGRRGRYGFSISPDLQTGQYHEDVETYELPAKYPESFQIENVEVWGLGRGMEPERGRENFHVRRTNTRIRDGDVDMNDLVSQIS